MRAEELQFLADACELRVADRGVHVAGDPVVVEMEVSRGFRESITYVAKVWRKYVEGEPSPLDVLPSEGAAEVLPPPRPPLGRRSEPAGVPVVSGIVRPSCGRCGVPYDAKLTECDDGELVAGWAPVCGCWTLAPGAQER